MATMRRIEKHPIVDELSKQYEVEEVSLDAPVSAGVYDALVVVQPSSLAPPQFARLLEAIKSGVPTAVFEDPFPAARRDITPTGEAKQQSGGMFGMGGGQPVPKGDIRELWDVLELKSKGSPGIQYYNSDIVWQDFNPYPNMELNVDPFWSFIDENAPGVERGQALGSESPITDGLRQVLALYAGSIAPADETTLKHTPMLSTGMVSGTLPVTKLTQLMQTGMEGLTDAIDGVDPQQIIALTVEGNSTGGEESGSEGGADAGETPRESAAIQVAYIAGYGSDAARLPANSGQSQSGRRSQIPIPERYVFAQHDRLADGRNGLH